MADAREAESHRALSAAARAHGAGNHRLVRAVSTHHFARTVSFATLNALHTSAKALLSAHPQMRDYTGVDGQCILYSAAFTPRSSAPPPPPRRKRGREEDFAEAAAASIRRVRRVAPGSALPQAEADIGEAVLTRLLRDVRGPNGETLMQSYGIFVKKMRDSDERPSLVLAARMHGGVGVPMGALKHALGSCWHDGALTTDEESSVLTGITLPSTDAADAAAGYGQSSVFLVTSAPHAKE